jgi:hypothetical protein
VKVNPVSLACGTPGRLLLAGILVALHLGLVAVLADTVPWTPDERGYFFNGRNLLLGMPWEVPEQRFQGPLGLLANQLFVDGAAVGPAEIDAVRTPARLGMLVFPLLLLGVVGTWAWLLHGPGGAVVALGLAATSPTLLAYGPLLAVDVALAATVVLAFFTLWLWLRRPSPARLLGLGLALGLCLATKYTALLLALAVPLAVAIALVRGADPRPDFARHAPAGLGRRSAWAFAALLVAAMVSLLTLHACYLFQAPRFDPATAGELGSGPFRALRAIPGGSALLALFPEPFVLGADYQAAVSRDFGGTFLDHDRAHWAYYPASLLTKTPLGALGLFALALLAPRGGTAARRRSAAVCLATPAVLLLAYLSVASSLQMGIRYLLPLLPLGFVAAGAWATSPLGRRPVGKVLTGLAALSCSAAVALPWPHHIGYFNALVGGSAGGFRLFADGNIDWLQRFEAGRDALQRRHAGELVFLRPGDDPRFGLCAGYALDLKPPDPERPGRTYHWVTRFPVVDHDSAAWLLFRATREDYEAAIAAGDARAAFDLALASLRERSFEQAKAALGRAPAGPRTAALAAVVEAAERAAGSDAEAPAQVVDGLQALGCEELALEFFGEPSRDLLPRWFLLAVDAGRLPEATQRMQAVVGGDAARPVEVLMLAQGLFWQGRPEAARDVLLAHEEPPADDPLFTNWQKFRDEVQQAARAVEKLRGLAARNER